jgi:hypothetical protein
MGALDLRVEARDSVVKSVNLFSLGKQILWLGLTTDIFLKLKAGLIPVCCILGGAIL